MMVSFESSSRDLAFYEYRKTELLRPGTAGRLEAKTGADDIWQRMQTIVGSLAGALHPSVLTLRKHSITESAP